MDISKDLSWNTHINRITNNANKSLGFLRRNIQTRNSNIRQLAYKTIVRPQVEYATSVWSPHTLQNIQKIENVQRRAVRWVKHNYSQYDSVNSMQQELGWQTLHDRRYDTKLIIFFKIIQGLVAVPLPSYIERPTRFTLHMHLLSYRQIHTTANYYKFSFFPSAIVMWNNLPATTVFHPDLEGFKQFLSSPSAP